MAAKIYLAVVGAAYLLLAVWCAVKPSQTSRSVGFDLLPGSGQSEYLVVYGGLQLGLGLFFLMPFLEPDSLKHCLLACIMIHVVLVVFRSLSFVLYTGIQTTTYILAATEWVIALTGVYCYWSMKG